MVIQCQHRWRRPRQFLKVKNLSFDRDFRTDQKQGVVRVNVHKNLIQASGNNAVSVLVLFLMIRGHIISTNAHVS